MKGRTCCICGRPFKVWGFAFSLKLLAEAGFKDFKTADRHFAHDNCIRRAQNALETSNNNATHEGLL